MLIVFSYSDYREYIRDFYLSKKSLNSAFSYRYLAQKAGINSSSFYKYVIEGKRNLTKGTLLKTCQMLKLNTAEAEYFESLVFFNQAKTIKEKNHFFDKLIALRNSCDVRVVNEEQYDFYAECGGGSDTDALTGVVTNADGYNTAGLTVNLFDANYLPMYAQHFHAVVNTNEYGIFKFKSLSAGIYNLVCIDSVRNTGCIVPHLQIGNFDADSQVVCTLKPIGSVAGIVVCADSNLQNMNTKNGYVYILGSSFWSNIDSNGGFLLTNVPPGKFTLNFCNVVQGQGITQGRDSLIFYNGPEMSLEPGSKINLDSIDISSWQIQP